MSRLARLPSRLSAAPSRKMATTSARERRMTGRRLQDRRWRMWQKDPHCADCGRVVEFPHGFELDHEVPLFMGGEDTEDNCQLLCVRYDGRNKLGCHAAKTAREA